MKRITALLVATVIIILGGVIAPTAQAANLYWDGSSSSWGTLSSWSTASGATTPDPTAVPGASDDVIFNITTANGAETISLNGNRSALSLTFNNTGTTLLRGNVTGTTTARTLTIGVGGITVASTAGAVTISDGTDGAVNLILSGSQTWNNNSTTTVTMGGTISHNVGAILTLGVGTFTAANFGTVNGIIGPWAITGSGTSLKYVTKSSNVLGAYSGGTAASDGASLTGTGGTLNYDLAAGGGTVPATFSANTVRYTGAAGSTTPGATSFTVNGLMNAGTGKWTINGGTVTVGANNELVIISNSQDFEISSVIKDKSASNSAVTYSGGGTLTLSGNNTFTGGLNIGSGKVVVNNAGALNSTTANVINFTGTSGTLTLNGNSGTITGINNISSANLTANRVLENASASNVILTIGGASTTSSFYGLIQDGTGGGTLGITKVGTGVLTIGLASSASPQANTFSGAVTIKAGTLQLANALGSGGQQMTPGGSSAVVYYLGDTTGTEAATLYIANNNITFNNPVTVQAGSSGVKTWGIPGTGVTASNSGTVTLNDNLTFNIVGSTLALSGLIQDGNQGAKGITKSGTGTLILSGNNTFSGVATITTGVLTATKAAALPGYGTAGKVVVNGGVLNLVVGGAGWTTGEVDTLLSNGTLTSGGIGIDTTNGSVTQWTALTPSNLGTLGLVKNGVNTLILNQANTFTGNVTVNLGVLKLTDSNALGTGTKTVFSEGQGRTIQLSNNITLSSDITLRMTSNSTEGNGLYSVDGNNTVQGNIVITTGNPILAIGSAAGSTLTISGTISLSSTARPLSLLGPSKNLNTVSGNIIGTGLRLEKNGTGTWLLSGNNTYTGTTSVNNGLLLTTKAAAVSGYNSTGSVTFGGGILGVRIGGAGWTTSEVDTLLSSATKTSGSLGIDTTNGDLTQWTTFTTANFGSALGLVKLGTGTLLLDQASNNYVGKTVVQSGTLSFTTGNTTASAAQSLGTNTDVDLGVAGFSSGILNYTGGAGTLAKNINVLGNGSDTIQNSGSGLLTLSGALNKNGTTLTLKGGANGITVSGTITGSSANSDLIIDGGVTTLASANTYNGPTDIRNGATLNANVTDALPTANGRTAVIMDATGSGSSTLALGASQSIASLAGTLTSAVNLGGNTLTIGTTSGNTTFAGAISGTGGSLVKDDNSTQTLSGINTYTGNTTINAGTLTLASTSGMRFQIGAASESNNRITGSGGTVNLDGTFTFDLALAGTAVGNSWTIVDDTNITANYQANFTVASLNGVFTETTSGVWNRLENNVNYRFTELDGVLTVIPEPSALALVGLGLVGMLATSRWFRRQA